MDEIISAENFINYAVETYSDTVYRVALNITQNPHDSFDISQEVFIRLVKNYKKIGRTKKHLKAWLIRVTVNCSRSFMKTIFRHEIISLDDIKESELKCELTKIWKSLNSYGCYRRNILL